MTEQAAEAVDELGPVDWIVVEFPGSRFKGEIAPVMAGLADQGTIRILDLRTGPGGPHGRDGGDRGRRRPRGGSSHRSTRGPARPAPVSRPQPVPTG
jgi:hypothetical protein